MAEPADCALVWTEEAPPTRRKQGTAERGRALVALTPRTSPEPLPDGWRVVVVVREAGNEVGVVVEAEADGAFRVQLAAAPGDAVEAVFTLRGPPDDGAEGADGPITVQLITPSMLPRLVRSRCDCVCGQLVGEEKHLRPGLPCDFATEV